MKQDIQQYYNQNARAYEKHGSALLVDILEKFIEDSKPKSTLLDLGSGVGQDTEYFSKKGFLTVGFDFSEEMMAIATKRSEPFIPILGDMRETLPFPVATFDKVWASSSLFTHLGVEEREGALKEVNRVLKPSGIFGGIAKYDDGSMFPFFSFSVESIHKMTVPYFSIFHTKRFATPDNSQWVFFMARKS